MPNQSGKIVLVLVLLLLVLGVVVYFLFPSFQESIFLEQSPNSSAIPISVNKDAEKTPMCNSELDNSESVTLEVWNSLPDDFRKLTYREGAVSAGEATYQIYPLKSTSDCRYQAVLLELVARGGGAYDDDDYKYRGLYIFDLENKKITEIMLISKNLLFDRSEYGSNLWVDNNQYQFVISENIKEGSFLKSRYSYDLQNDKLTKSVKAF